MADPSQDKILPHHVKDSYNYKDRYLVLAKESWLMPRLEILLSDMSTISEEIRTDMKTKIFLLEY